MKKIISVIAALVFSFSLAACGNKASTGNKNHSVTTIQVATAGESKPLSWKANGNKIYGYEPDVLRAIDKKLKNYKFELKSVSDDAEETGLATGKYDIASGGYYISTERKKQFYVPTQNVGLSLIKIYKRKGSNIEDLKDLVGKKIVPPDPGGGIYNFLTTWNKNNPKYKIDFQASSSDIPTSQRLKEVENRKYDALIEPSNLGEDQIIKNLNLKIVTTKPVQVNKTFLLIHKSSKNKKLNREVNNALKELKDDGTLSKLSKKYFGEDIFKYE